MTSTHPAQFQTSEESWRTWLISVIFLRNDAGVPKFSPKSQTSIVSKFSALLPTNSAFWSQLWYDLLMLQRKCLRCFCYIFVNIIEKQLLLAHWNVCNLFILLTNPPIAKSVLIIASSAYGTKTRTHFCLLLYYSSGICSERFYELTKLLNNLCFLRFLLCFSNQKFGQAFIS